MPCHGDNCTNPGVYDTKTRWNYLSLCADCVEVYSEKFPNSFCIIAGPELLPVEEQEEMAAELDMSREEMLLNGAA